MMPIPDDEVVAYSRDIDGDHFWVSETGDVWRVSGREVEAVTFHRDIGGFDAPCAVFESRTGVEVQMYPSTFKRDARVGDGWQVYGRAIRLYDELDADVDTIVEMTRLDEWKVEQMIEVLQYRRETTNADT